MRKALLLILILLPLLSSAQLRKQKNYRDFDSKYFHFGFTLGFNTSDFQVKYNPDLLFDNNLLRIYNRRQAGFNLGIISSLNIFSKTLKLRFIPSLSFQERLFEFDYYDPSMPNSVDLRDARIESTYLDFPLMLKYRTFRYNNFAAYFVTGIQYSLDLASQIDINNGGPDPLIIIDKHDYAGQVGVGVDFFLPYFKFGIELKYSHGIKNILIQDNTRYARHLDELRSKVWWVSFTFEG